MSLATLALLAASLAQATGAIAPETDSAAPRRSQVRVETDSESERLQVDLLGEGRTVSCPEPVQAGHPCLVTDGPTGWTDFTVHGSRSFQQAIELLPGPNTVRVGYRGHGPAVVGAAFIAGGIAFVAKGGTGPTLSEDGSSRLYLDVGAIAMTIGAILIVHDFMRQHDLVEVSNP
jgi:hypothetical protein